MTNNPTDKELRLVSFLIAVLLVAMGVVTLASWGMASLGLPVESLLSEEAIRWLFRQSAGSVTLPISQWLLLAAVTVGAVMHSGLPSWRTHNAVARWSVLITWLVLLVLLALLYLAPWSPLRSATGRLFPTPFLGGFIRALAVSVIVAAAVFGGVSGKLRTWSHYVTLLFVGIQRFAPWLLIAMLASVLYHIITYAF